MLSGCCLFMLKRCFIKNCLNSLFYLNIPYPKRMSQGKESTTRHIHNANVKGLSSLRYNCSTDWVGEIAAFKF